jgi:hypothetical protein
MSFILPDGRVHKAQINFIPPVGHNSNMLYKVSGVIILPEKDFNIGNVYLTWRQEQLTHDSSC